MSNTKRDAKHEMWVEYAKRKYLIERFDEQYTLTTYKAVSETT